MLRVLGFFLTNWERNQSIIWCRSLEDIGSDIQFQTQQQQQVRDTLEIFSEILRTVCDRYVWRWREPVSHPAFRFARSLNQNRSYRERIGKSSKKEPADRSTLCSEPIGVCICLGFCVHPIVHHERGCFRRLRLRGAQRPSPSDLSMNTRIFLTID